MDDPQAPTADAPPAQYCVKLFGVQLTNSANHQHASMIMRKSVSTGSLGLMGSHTLQRNPEYPQLRTELGAAQPRWDMAVVRSTPQQGYASDGLMQSSSLTLRERKKGIPWNEEEHRMFLAGLQKLGKGDWRGISRNFVTSRTPTQVASHAQKYFLRQGNLNKHKRRSSLFDIINSNMVPASNAIRDRSQTSGAMEHVGSHSELSLQQVTAASSSLPTPSVCADLCLGRCSHSRQCWQVSAENVSSALRQSGKQASVMGPLPSSQLFSSKQRSGIDEAMATDHINKSVCTISSSSSSSKSMSSAPSLCTIDETSELSSLSLSLGPSMSPLEASELALRLEQPVTSRLSVTPSAMNELKEVLQSAAAAGAAAGNTNKVSTMANAIRVV